MDYKVISLSEAGHFMPSAETSRQPFAPVEASRFVVRSRSVSDEGWRCFTASDPHLSLYHSPQWLNLLSRAYGLKLGVAALEDGRSVLAGLIYAFSRNPLSRRAVALPFSDYCPPVARERVYARCLLELIGRKIGVEDVSLAHVLRARAFEVRGFEAPAPWETVKYFENWELDLTRPLSALERSLAESFRRRRNQARRTGVRIERGAELGFVRRFYAMHLETRRRLGVPVQPFRFFKLAREVFAAVGAFEVWLAVEDGRDAAALVLLRYRNRVYYKWGARSVCNPPLHANHLLFWSLMEEYAGKADVLDCGRTDKRNHGLVTFKKRLGAQPLALPYAFLPHAPRELGAEVSESALRKLASQLWRRLPIPLTRALSFALYRTLV